LWQQGWTLTPARFFLDRDEDRQNAMLGSKPMSFCSDLLFVASHAQALAVKAQVLHLLTPQKATACDFEGNTCVVLLGVDREAVDRELGITENRRFLDIRLLDLPEWRRDYCFRHCDVTRWREPSVRGLLRSARIHLGVGGE
jgi:hypothetical protein